MGKLNRIETFRELNAIICNDPLRSIALTVAKLNKLLRDTEVPEELKEDPTYIEFEERMRAELADVLTRGIYGVIQNNLLKDSGEQNE